MVRQKVVEEEDEDGGEGEGESESEEEEDGPICGFRLSAKVQGKLSSEVSWAQHVAPLVSSIYIHVHNFIIL